MWRKTEPVNLKLPNGSECVGLLGQAIPVEFNSNYEKRQRICMNSLLQKVFLALC